LSFQEFQEINKSKGQLLEIKDCPLK